MQLSHVSAVILLQLAALISASPIIDPTVQEGSASIKSRQNGGGIGSCETEVAAEQVACIDGCGGDASCILDCTATAVQGYTQCPANGGNPRPPKA